MSILIKGMDMPESCEECRFSVDGWCYACVPNSNDERQRITTNWCPLVEVKTPHGRLIDVDAILQDSGKAMRFESDDLYHKSILEFAPPIIEAEEG